MYAKKIWLCGKRVFCKEPIPRISAYCPQKKLLTSSFTYDIILWVIMRCCIIQGAKKKISPEDSPYKTDTTEYRRKYFDGSAFEERSLSCSETAWIQRRPLADFFEKRKNTRKISESVFTRTDFRANFIDDITKVLVKPQIAQDLSPQVRKFQHSYLQNLPKKHG